MMKKIWIKPECVKIKLVPEETCLPGCKTNPGGPNPCVGGGPPTFGAGS
ncbi:MAG: hypothetical protein V3V59_02595 [Thermodesulfovibrionales bacterium]